MVTITGKTSSVDYDGEEHTITGYDVDISNPLYKVTDFTFSGTAEAKRKDAGKTDMGLAEEQFANTNSNFKKVTFNVIDGYQEIKPIDIVVTITGNKTEVDYDGNEHTAEGYKATANSDLYDVTKDFTFSGTAKITKADAGTYPMGLAEDQFENTNTNFGTVTFNVTDGELKIKPIDVTVTITGHNSTLPYDGDEHTVAGYDAEASSDLYDVTKDFTFSGTASAARTDAGQTNMGLAEDQFSNTNPNFATVTFDVTDGYQKIEPIKVTVTITGNTSSVDFDDEEHTITGYTATADSDLYDVTKDFTFSGEATASRTNVIEGEDADGKTDMGLTSDQFVNNNKNFTDVAFVVTDGYQEIKPLDVTVTVTGHSDSVTYDGNEHSVSGYDVAINSNLYTENDFTCSGSAYASGTNAGTYQMGLAANQFTNNNQTGNFNVTFNVSDGSLTIAKATIVVKITGNADDSREYNGTEQSITGYTVEIPAGADFTEQDIVFTGEAIAAGTNVGTYPMGLAADQFSVDNSNYTVEFDVTDGSLTITPKAVTVTADDKSKYVGEDDPELTWTVEGLVGDDTESVLTVDITRAQGEEPGTYDIIPSGAEQQGNYTVEYVNGTLTIKKIPPIPPTPDDPDDDDDPTPTPAPDDDDNGNPGNPAPAVNPAPAPAPAIVPFTAPDNPQNINPDDVPLDPGEDIEEPDTPLAPAGPVTVWALLNLLCTIASVIFSLFVLIFYLGKKKDEETENEDGTTTTEQKDVKKKGLLRLIDIIPAAVAVITFILTEDMSADMVLTDKWTLLMVVILLVDVVVGIFTKKTVKDADEEEETEQGK